MEGTMLLLLIAISATAATSKYEYKYQDVQEIHKTLDLLYNFSKDVKLHNVDAVVEWKMLPVDSKADIHFKVTNFEKSSGKNCGGGPGFSILDGPLQCLFRITFHTGIKGGKDTLNFGLVFRSSEDQSQFRAFATDVFLEAEDQAENLPGVEFVKPISTEHLTNAVKQNPFEMTTSWFEKIIKRGVYFLDSESKKKLVSNVYDENLIVYYAFPLVMDTKTVNKILYKLSSDYEEGEIFVE